MRPASAPRLAVLPVAPTLCEREKRLIEIVQEFERRTLPTYSPKVADCFRRFERNRTFCASDVALLQTVISVCRSLMKNVEEALCATSRSQQVPTTSGGSSSDEVSENTVRRAYATWEEAKRMRNEATELQRLGDAKKSHSARPSSGLVATPTARPSLKQIQLRPGPSSLHANNNVSHLTNQSVSDASVQRRVVSNPHSPTSSSLRGDSRVETVAPDSPHSAVKSSPARGADTREALETIQQLAMVATKGEAFTPEALALAHQSFVTVYGSENGWHRFSAWLDELDRHHMRQGHFAQ